MTDDTMPQSIEWPYAFDDRLFKSDRETNCARETWYISLVGFASWQNNVHLKIMLFSNKFGILAQVLKIGISQDCFSKVAVIRIFIVKHVLNNDLNHDLLWDAYNIKVTSSFGLCIITGMYYQWARPYTRPFFRGEFPRFTADCGEGPRAHPYTFRFRPIRCAFSREHVY